MTWPIIGVRPWPPPTTTRKPVLPAASRTACTPMSWTRIAARSARRAGDGDLELARQEREFGMQRRPLADQLAPRTRIDDLVGGDAGERIAGGVAHAVAGGLDRVHLDPGELGEDLRNVLEARPVELDVLPGGEVAVAAVVLAGDVGERAQLGATRGGRRESRPAASARASGCRGRSAGAAAGTRPRSARPPGSAASGRETARRARRRCVWSKSS